MEGSRKTPIFAIEKLNKTTLNNIKQIKIMAKFFDFFMSDKFEKILFSVMVAGLFVILEFVIFGGLLSVTPSGSACMLLVWLYAVAILVCAVVGIAAVNDYEIVLE